MSTNFSIHQYYDLRKIRLYLSVVLVLIVAAVLYSTNLINEIDKNIVQAEKTKDVLQYELNVVQRTAESIPDYSTLKEIERMVDVVRQITHTKGDTTVKVLGTIEEMLPENAALTSFYHKLDIGEIDITVAANDTLSLTAFVHALEESERFSQVLITRQSHKEQETETFAYDIRIIQDDAK